jgi:hypothetical protein
LRWLFIYVIGTVLKGNHVEIELDLSLRVEMAVMAYYLDDLI